MPRSILLGGPMPAPGEPLWTREDLDLALAWQTEVDSACPGCGQPADQAWNPDHLDHWVAEVRTCWACAAVDRKNKQLEDGDKAGQYIVTEFDPGGGGSG